MSETGNGGTCCICGREYDGFGNNPWPVVEDEDARCCDDCNREKVIIARVRKALEEQKGAIISVVDVTDAAQRLVDAMTAYVNEPDSNEERRARDEKVYPMVFGVNLLANMLVHGYGIERVPKAIAHFCNGGEIRDKYDGTPMRRVG